MASKDVCSPWPFKCSPQEVREEFNRLRQEPSTRIDLEPVKTNLLETSIEEDYYTPSLLPVIRQ